MAIALEGRLRKIEKTVEARLNQDTSDAYDRELRAALERLRATPQSRAAGRAYCCRQFRAMRAEERKRYDDWPPDQLTQLMKQWAIDDSYYSVAVEERYVKEANMAAEDIEPFY